MSLYQSNIQNSLHLGSLNILFQNDEDLIILFCHWFSQRCTCIAAPFRMTFIACNGREASVVRFKLHCRIRYDGICDSCGRHSWCGYLLNIHRPARALWSRTALPLATWWGWNALITGYYRITPWLQYQTTTVNSNYACKMKRWMCWTAVAWISLFVCFYCSFWL